MVREMRTVPGRIRATGSRTAKVGCPTVGVKRRVSWAAPGAAEARTASAKAAGEACGVFMGRGGVGRGVCSTAKCHVDALAARVGSPVASLLAEDPDRVDGGRTPRRQIPSERGRG